jgi:hypothetical protein
VRPLFRNDLVAQKKKLMAMLSTVVTNLHQVDKIAPLGRGSGKAPRRLWSFRQALRAGRRRAAVDSGRNPRRRFCAVRQDGLDRSLCNLGRHNERDRRRGYSHIEGSRGGAR